MIFLPAASADAEELARLESAQPRAAGWGKNGFETEIAQSCSAVWCAWEEGRLTAFCALRATAGFCEILNMAVLPQRTGKGVGFALLARVFEELKKQGVTRVTLEVAETNIPARALYAKAGFVALSRRKDFYGPGQDALVMGVEW